MISEADERRMTLADEMLACVRELDGLGTAFAVAARCRKFSTMYEIGNKVKVLATRVGEITKEVLK